ncbi:BatD family protein [Rhodanobacter sp. MP1X3]|uniref:BatD family protein n=1 Tax=Rhodanobacter sp. MP1X3 TaxID=2723086 RepID=UPI001622602A|nr:hypothetical protein [Rhodanobacter sp. MP1X3]
MIYRRLIAWCLLSLMLIPAFVHAGDVQATLDRTSVSLGETVTLNLRIQGDASNLAMPDLGVLGSDFDMLGTSQNSSVSVVNGAATSELTLGVVLRPRHTGTLQIPSLVIAGSRTAPLQLEVTVADASDNVAAHRDVFMESQVEPNQGYVGQQLSYVVRLFFATTISDGSLEAPQLNGIQFNKIGDDTNYSVERGGRQYHVLERRYALIPQHAGRVEIPALNFQGVAIDPADPDSFFGARKPVSASAPAVTIDIKPTPADWGGTAWLPARQIGLKLDGLPDAQTPVRVGQPLNLTMNLQATGLPVEALPALSMPPLDGATAYPDKPTTTSRNDGPWIVGQRQQAFAIVPNRAGTLTIPATTLKWWNVLADRMEVAQIPAHSFSVLPASGGSDVHTANPATAATAASAVAPVTWANAPTTPWRWIAIGSIALWLLSVMAWLIWRRYQRERPASVAIPNAPNASARERQQAFLVAARGSNTSEQVRSLLAWARIERPAIQHLGDLAALLGDEQQRTAIASLQQRHYASASMSGSDAPLAEVFKRGFIWCVADKGDEGSDLPPLYPFKLH